MCLLFSPLLNLSVFPCHLVTMVSVSNFLATQNLAASTGFVEFPPQGEFQNDMKHGSCAQILFLFLMENLRGPPFFTKK